MCARSRGEIGDRRPSLAAIQAVAAFRGREPTETADNLYDHVDPDALDALVGNPAGGPVAVEFRMGDQVIELRSGGCLEVRDLIDG